MQTVPYDDVIASLPSMEKVTNKATCSCKTTLTLREVCGKSKWKFKMAFAMKGGGSRGGLVCH